MFVLHQGLAAALVSDLAVTEEVKAFVAQVQREAGVCDVVELPQWCRALVDRLPPEWRVCVVQAKERFCSAGHMSGLLCSHVRAVARHMGGLENFNLNVNSLLGDSAELFGVPAAEGPEHGIEHGLLESGDGGVKVTPELSDALANAVKVIAPELQKLREEWDDKQYEYCVRQLRDRAYQIGVQGSRSRRYTPLATRAANIRACERHIRKRGLAKAAAAMRAQNRQQPMQIPRAPFKPRADVNGRKTRIPASTIRKLGLAGQSGHVAGVRQVLRQFHLRQVVAVQQQAHAGASQIAAALVGASRSDRIRLRQHEHVRQRQQEDREAILAERRGRPRRGGEGGDRVRR